MGQSKLIFTNPIKSTTIQYTYPNLDLTLTVKEQKNSEKTFRVYSMKNRELIYEGKDYPIKVREISNMQVYGYYFPKPKRAALFWITITKLKTQQFMK
jgi:hypothetical protein